VLLILSRLFRATISVFFVTCCPVLLSFYLVLSYMFEQNKWRWRQQTETTDVSCYSGCRDKHNCPRRHSIQGSLTMQSGMLPLDQWDLHQIAISSVCLAVCHTDELSWWIFMSIIHFLYFGQGNRQLLHCFFRLCLTCSIKSSTEIDVKYKTILTCRMT